MASSSLAQPTIKVSFAYLFSQKKLQRILDERRDALIFKGVKISGICDTVRWLRRILY